MLTGPSDSLCKERTMNTESILSTILAVIASIGGLLATLLLATLILAGAANSSPRDEAILKISLITTLAVGAACLIAAIVAMVMGKGWLAVIIGAAPVLTSVLIAVALVWLMRPTPGNF